MRRFTQVLPDCYIDRDMVVAFRRTGEEVVVGFLDKNETVESLRHTFDDEGSAKEWFDRLAVLFLS